MRLRFFAFAAFFLPCFAWLGCEWAREQTPEVREATWGAEVIVSIAGKGSIVSTESGIRCPEICYGRIVSNLAAEAAPRSITLRATPDPGYRFARWEADGARVAGNGPGPSECNPVRRPALTPDLGSAAEVTLPFGEVDGYPPPGMSEKCVRYSRVPVAYNLTAVFESAATTTANDVWAKLSPPDNFEDLMVTTGHVIARVVNGANGKWGVAMVDRQDPSVMNTLRLEIDSFVYDMTHHVVWQGVLDGRLGLVNRNTGQLTVWNPNPSSLNCRSLTSTSQYVYCRTFDQLVRWTIGGANQTTIATDLPQGAAMTSDGTSVFLVEDGTSTGASTIRRLTPPASPDAGAPILEIVVGSLSSPRMLRADAMFLHTIVDSFGGDVMRIPLSGGAQAFTYSVGDFGLLYAPEPPVGDPRLWIASSAPDFSSSWEITSRSKVNVPKPFRVGLRRVTGLAIDGEHVYWTQDDARIYRGRK